MAWQQFTIVLSFISLFIRYGVVSAIRISHISNVSSGFLPSPADGSLHTTMLLPLFPPKDTSRRVEISRRHLQKSPASARMSLHDDLLINGFEFVAIAQNLNLGTVTNCFGCWFLNFWCRYYTTHIWIGTPPQKFALIVDTGSTVTYVPCSSCKKCGNHQVGSSLNYIFVLLFSISFFWINSESYRFILIFQLCDLLAQ